MNNIMDNFNQGMKAYCDGQGLSTSPYDGPSTSNDAWQTGYRYASELGMPEAANHLTENARLRTVNAALLEAAEGIKRLTAREHVFSELCELLDLLNAAIALAQEGGDNGPAD